MAGVQEESRQAVYLSHVGQHLTLFVYARAFRRSFYGTCFLLGVGVGYWALFVTIAAEQFGTNLRSTVATSVPNFIRGTVILLVPAFQFLRQELGGDDQAVIYGALIVGVGTIIIALIALRYIHETFGHDMNFIEK